LKPETASVTVCGVGGKITLFFRDDSIPRISIDIQSQINFGLFLSLLF
jgi:hypothetical protein